MSASHHYNSIDPVENFGFDGRPRVTDDPSGGFCSGGDRLLDALYRHHKQPRFDIPEKLGR